MAQKEVGIVLKVFDKATSEISKIGNSLSNFAKNNEKTFKTMAISGGAAFGAITLGVKKLIDKSSGIERTRQTFDNLVESIGGDATDALTKMKVATNGLVDNLSLMNAGNKFVSMGLATTTDEMAKLSKIATVLGGAMGTDATKSMEDFALMLANQSIQRLDSFGISSGVVRKRIDELTSATKGMTREQAFMQAVMEQGDISMERLGDLTATNGEKIQQYEASISNLMTVLGEAFLPVLGQISEKLVPIMTTFGERANKNSELVGNIIIITGAIAGLVAGLGILGLAIPGIITAITLFASPIGILIAAILLLAFFMVKNRDVIKQATTEAIDYVGTKLTELADWIGEYFIGIFDTVFGLFGIKFEDLKNMFSSLINFISIFLSSEGRNKMNEAWTNLVSGIIGVVKPPLNAVLTFIEGTVNRVISLINSLIRSFNKVGGKVGVSMGEMSPLNIPKLAEGGIVTKPTLAMVGEGNESEAVIPLSKLNNMMNGSGGANITINMGGVAVSNEADENRLAEKITEQITRQMQLYNFGIS